MDSLITTENEMRARHAIGLLDLMALNIDDTEQRIVGICQRALTPMGVVAAVCVYPRFALLARMTLDRQQTPEIRVVAVVNFPYGSPNIDIAVSETRAAVMAGADEVDLVYPFRTLLSGDQQTGRDMIQACRDACGSRVSLTVTLETGDLRDPQIIRDACNGAIMSGADFIKTSTGKLIGTATPQAARIMLEAIADVGGQVGIKFCGGLRTFSEASVFLEIAQARFGPQWVNPQRLRLAGSSILDDILSQLGVLAAGPSLTSY